MAKQLAGKLLRHISLMNKKDKEMVVNLCKMERGHTKGNLENLKKIQTRYNLGDPKQGEEKESEPKHRKNHGCS